MAGPGPDAVVEGRGREPPAVPSAPLLPLPGGRPVSGERSLVAATGALLRTCRSVDHEGEVSGWALIAPRGGHWSKLRHWPGESTERWAVRCEKAPVCIQSSSDGPLRPHRP